MLLHLLCSLKERAREADLCLILRSQLDRSEWHPYLQFHWFNFICPHGNHYNYNANFYKYLSALWRGKKKRKIRSEKERSRPSETNGTDHILWRNEDTKTGSMRDSVSGGGGGAGQKLFASPHFPLSPKGSALSARELLPWCTSPGKALQSLSAGRVTQIWAQTSLTTPPTPTTP